MSASGAEVGGVQWCTRGGWLGWVLGGVLYRVLTHPLPWAMSFGQYRHKHATDGHIDGSMDTHTAAWHPPMSQGKLGLASRNRSLLVSSGQVPVQGL